MGKRMTIIWIAVLSLLTILATGCVFGPKDNETGQIDPPQEDYTEVQDSTEIVFEFGSEEEAGSPEGEQEGSVSVSTQERTLYLFDHQGYVVPLTVQLPHTEGVATQALEYLVVDGPVTEYLPNGMRAVLPAGTELSVNVKENGIAVVNFSNEFKNYHAEDEKGILEAITWTLTEFETINEVQVMINGYETNVMPVNQTPIGESFSRKDGINVEVASGTALGRTTAITLYFKAQSPSANHEYYVPVTRLVPRSQDLVVTTIKELIAGPQLGSGLVSDVLPSTEVLSIEHDGETVLLNFDETLLQYTEEEELASDATIEAVVLSLTEGAKVHNVQFLVNGESGAKSPAGYDLSQPVTRPIAINQTGF
ncbi:GerMN domain-containing protein [Bacillus horti]|uniref:Germination protein M n=1 Tax=Caldalkalibacillus horti TaxID=77523 RepID=A0ABT9VTN1_9BACI|nr:GerMN domain-containing protein [Bacillus horti]MDQ0164341.1 germination protein M [Bacillus horti]